MINEIKKNITNYPLLFFFICYLSILLGFYIDENSIDGAKHDYIYHLVLVEGFKNNFSLTIKNFGSNPDVFATKNSPIFFIILGLLNKIFQLDYLRILNTLVSLLIVIIFYNCLLLKYKNIKKVELIILSSLLFLSPTIRSLSVWPYSLLWGLFFFLITIFYYLKFELIKKDIKYVVISTLFLAISSYFYLAFSVFGLFFFTQFIIKLDTIKNKTITILLNILLALPAVIFFYKQNFYFFYAEGLIINEYQRYNISNKILIISSLIFYFCIPIFIFNYKNIINKIFNKNYYAFKTIILTILITLFYTFNYPITNNFGGGFFFKISHLLFKNNYLFYFLSAISLISILILFNKNKINYLILFILFFLYNLQFTIYNKYYEPLIFIISFLLLELNLEKNFFSKKNYITILFFFFISHYVISIGRIFLEIKF